MNTHTRGADISPCEVYRWRLWREWGDATRRVCWIMLNPSTADGTKDDATIRRVIGFSKAWGYGALDVVNLFAMRARDPRELRRPHGRDPIGAVNENAILNTAQHASIVVAAWGRNGSAWGRNVQVTMMVQLVSDIHAVRLLDDGEPEHPLYLPAALTPVLYRSLASGIGATAK